MKGKVLGSIVKSAKYLVSENNDRLELVGGNTLIFDWYNHQPIETSEPEGYWNIKWLENDEGDDILLLHEQENPEPFPSKWFEKGKKYKGLRGDKYISHFSRIKDIQGYGFTNKDGELFLIHLLIETEIRFILIKTNAAAIHIEITEKRPLLSDQQIF